MGAELRPRDARPIRPTETGERLEREMRQVLAELAMLAEGRTQTFDGRVAGSRDRSPIMRLAEQPLHERFAVLWEEARGEEARSRVLKAAEAALRAARHSPPPPRDSPPWQELVGKDPRPPAVVAREWKITKQYAWQLQQRFRRENPT